ncbi:hypothetical protein [Ferrimonas sp. YFM]|uniref:hypothetical protein n=1 Tax=Ferrimonas sp. YFM TaxID=3028878 RepID=UPI0025723204|nr:hypothetical protein [Ferrimonas sp. YFM]BDY05669.1 hypothetical protein F0521_27100 [Ferrimonas sp. YFM]
MTTIVILLLAALGGGLLYRHLKLGKGLAPLTDEHLSRLESHLEQLKSSGMVNQQECDEFRRQFQ